MFVRKTRLKANDTLEVEVDCPRCGAKGKCGINVSKRVWYCWVCGNGGRIPSSWEEELSTSIPLRLESKGSTFVAPTEAEFPPVALWEIERRGFDPNWLRHYYNVRWDGERLAWPAGDGWVRRCVIPGLEPKCLTVPIRGLIGQHLLTVGQHIVLVEGDYKAAAIPLPWVGLGTSGTSLSQLQVEVLQQSRPAHITVMTDGGYVKEAWKMVGQVAPYPACVLELPWGKGPDDIPRSHLVELLLEGIDGTETG